MASCDGDVRLEILGKEKNRGGGALRRREEKVRGARESFALATVGSGRSLWAYFFFIFSDIAETEMG